MKPRTPLAIAGLLAFLAFGPGCAARTSRPPAPPAPQVKASPSPSPEAPPEPAPVASPPELTPPQVAAPEPSGPTELERLLDEEAEEPPEPEEFVDEKRQRRVRERRIKVAAWNVKNFSRNRDLSLIDKMGEVLEEYDVIGLEEIEDEEGPKLLKSALQRASNRKYGLVVTDKRGRTPNEAERYAFLYRIRTVRLSNHGKFADLGHLMHRPPYYALFETRHGGRKNFTFILMLVHTKPRPVDELKADLKGIADIRDDVLDRNKPTGEKDLITAGDFNASPSYVHFQTFLGTASHALSGGSSMVRGDRLNDNLIWGPPTVQDFTGTAGIDKFDEEMFTDSSGAVDTAAAEELSDHRPVWAEFWTGHDTDPPRP